MQLKKLPASGTDTYNIASYVPMSVDSTYSLEYGFAPRPHLNFGASKLIARFAQLLLTLTGSDKTEPGAGCSLLSLIADFHTSETGFLMSEVNQIINDVSFQMRHENDPEVIPESRFASATCTDIQIINDTARLAITIKTAADTKIEFILPIPTT